MKLLIALTITVLAQGAFANKLQERNAREHVIRNSGKAAQQRNITRYMLAKFIVERGLTMESWKKVPVAANDPHIELVRVGMGRSPKGAPCNFRLTIYSHSNCLLNSLCQNQRWAEIRAACESEDTARVEVFERQGRSMDKIEIESIEDIQTYVRRGYKPTINDI